MSKPLVGFMIIEDHTDDMSDWSGQITFPNPKGANLAWLDPVEMIEKAPVDSLLDEVEVFLSKCCSEHSANLLKERIKEFRSNE